MSMGIDVRFTTETVRLHRGQGKPGERVLSAGEEQILATYLLAHRDPYCIGILLSLFTGIRLGELCALRWDDVNLEGGVLHISRTLQRIKAGSAPGCGTKIVETPPKSISSHRSIPLVGKLREVLLGQEKPGAYILSGDDSHPVEPRRMDRHFKKILRACGIKETNFHTLRHTFGTRCIEAGMDPKTVSELLGHGNVSITLDWYVHPSMEHKAENIELLSDLLTVKDCGQET